jgi:Terminase large subunit, T4likevirus-type, N-terminal
MATVTTPEERFIAAAKARLANEDATADCEGSADGAVGDATPPDAAVGDTAADATLTQRIRRISLPYKPFPKQQRFHGSNAKYRLFGGAAGPGKSKALLMEAVLQAHDNPGSNTLLLRRTFPELEQTLLHYFRREIPREMYVSFQESKHLVTWCNGSTTRFGYCQRESDVYQYQGAEFLFIGIDELTLFTLRQWQFLTSRNRCPLPGTFPCMAGATNPGNIGHAWVKALWIDKQPAPGMENPAEYDPADYDFVPARVGDNPVYAGDANYLKALRALPSHLKRAFLDGAWDIFAGQYFDKFDVSRHVTRAEEIAWKPWWPRWISIDWGFEHPAAVYWHAAVPVNASGAAGSCMPLPGVANATASVGAQRAAPAANAQSANAPQTCVVSYREYVTHRTAPRDLAREIIRRSVLSNGRHSERSAPAGFSASRADGTPAHAVEESLFGVAAGESKRDPSTPSRGMQTSHALGAPRDSAQDDVPHDRERIDAIYLSPDAFARRTDEASIAEQMGDVFAEAGLPRPVPADDDRVGGWMLMYQMLDAGEWLLTDNCVELIRTLPNLVRDSARIEDIEKMDGDDPADAARYGLKSRYAAHRGDPNGWRSRMPLADRVSAHAFSADPTIRAMQARKFYIEEARGAGPVSFRHRRR